MLIARVLPTPLRSNLLRSGLACVLLAALPACAGDESDLDDLDAAGVIEVTFEPGVDASASQLMGPNTWEAEANILRRTAEPIGFEALLDELEPSEFELVESITYAPTDPEGFRTDPFMCYASGGTPEEVKQWGSPCYMRIVEFENPDPTSFGCEDYPSCCQIVIQCNYQ